MNKQRREIIGLLGAKFVARVPYTGGGAFGAARLAHIIQTEFSPSARLAAAPTASVPIRPKTATKLQYLARRASTPRHKVSATQMAAVLLEQAVNERCG